MGTEDDPNVWAEAAHALERDLGAYHAAGSIDKEFDEEYQLGAIRNAWQRAGDEAKARRLRFALQNCRSFPVRPIITNDMSKDG